MTKNEWAQLHQVQQKLEKARTLTFDDLDQQTKYNANMESAFNGYRSAPDIAVQQAKMALVGEALALLKTVTKG